MERKKASEFPQGLLDEFHLYVHGDINRRQFLDRAKKYAVGGLTAAGLFEMLKPNYAWAQQIAPDDGRISHRVHHYRFASGYRVDPWVLRAAVKPPRSGSPACSSCTRTAASTRMSRTWPGGWPPRTSWPSRQTG